MQTAASVTAVVALTCSLSAQSPPLRLKSEDARKHRGKVATVCGLVTAIACKPEGSALSFDSSKFRILIPPAVRATLGRRVEDRFDGRNVCVTGVIEKAPSGDQIVVTSLDSIVAEAEPPRPEFAPHAMGTCDPEVILPKRVKNVKPTYTREAMEARVEGDVQLRAVVEADGTVGEAEVSRRLHPDLDTRALLAVKSWRFEPATYRGGPVPVVVTITITFRR